MENSSGCMDGRSMIFKGCTEQTWYICDSVETLTVNKATFSTGFRACCQLGRGQWHNLNSQGVFSYLLLVMLPPYIKQSLLMKMKIKEERKRLSN
jgi:hypothetical protein